MQLQARFDELISWRVFSHRLPSSELSKQEYRSSGKYAFRPGVKAWSDFLGCIKEQLGRGKYLLSTDLANYFENINLKSLHQIMEGLLPDIKGAAADKAIARGQIDQLFNYLPQWSYTSERGLPQNRDASPSR